MNTVSKIRKYSLMTTMAAGLAVSMQAQAHFGMLIPSDDMVMNGESRTLKLDAMFWHPFEGQGMNLVKPEAFGVMTSDGEKHDLLSSLKPAKRKDVTGAKRDIFEANYKFRGPGDHTFYMVPKPYWEPAEDTFIVHYTKVVVNGFGLEEGWDKPVGLKTEIVPLTRPYGLYTNNVFQGQVLVNGKPMPGTEVEVEYFADGKMEVDASPMVTQVVKADANGVFTYAMPKSGWWGFAALNEDDKTIRHEGKDYPIEIGAVLWVKTHDMK
ncbi:MAG: DUF4198 domain-containing protein [Gammaproteobacteria bacterium]|nr:DUF4198 domain-containing protein [Gammaproteobacteria bacterium]